jgi:predicted pyridoxine 5'-phosphate oxidase superfamily flavin-nucleotide-binding protein
LKEARMTVHSGELAVQRRAGARVENWGTAHVGADIPPVGADFLRAQRFVVLGVADDEGLVWADLITGPERFVDPADERTVVIDQEPRFTGPLLDRERMAGMMAIEPWTRRRMRLNGRVGRERGRLVLRTDQVYANCPKYIQTRRITGEEGDPGPVGTAEALDGEQRELIGRADTFFVATQAPGLGADVSHRGGNPGFVSVGADGTLSWPDYIGNSMFMTLGNLELDARCGLLFVDWDRGGTLHLSGRARVDWDAGRAAGVPGARRMVDFSVERVRWVRNGMPLRWAFGEYHRFNPPVGRNG